MKTQFQVVLCAEINFQKRSKRDVVIMVDLTVFKCTVAHRKHQVWSHFTRFLLGWLRQTTSVQPRFVAAFWTKGGNRTLQISSHIRTWFCVHAARETAQRRGCFVLVLSWCTRTSFPSVPWLAGGKPYIPSEREIQVCAKPEICARATQDRGGPHCNLAVAGVSVVQKK